MSTHEKLLARMRNNPRDWRIDDLKAIANRLGIDWRNEGGSHHVFSFPGVEDDVCVPAELGGLHHLDVRDRHDHEGTQQSGQ